MKTLYIAYGSNLNLDQMAMRCPTAKVLGSSTLRGYQLLFRGYESGAVATIEKRANGKVPVLVWELETSDEKALDRYEGWPSFYRKEYIKINLNCKWVTAMVYIMNEGRRLGKPSQRYYNTILEGYRNAGFNTNSLTEAVMKSI